MARTLRAETHLVDFTVVEDADLRPRLRFEKVFDSDLSLAVERELPSEIV